MKEKPDHHDAELVLKLYDLRRETVMRESRKAMIDFLPRSWEDVFAVTQFGHPSNVAWRQVASYWEMAYSMARYGIVHGDFLVENGGEGLILYTKVEPYLERFRKEISPTAMLNAEWVAKETAAGRRLHAIFQGRIRQMLEAR